MIVEAKEVLAFAFEKATEMLELAKADYNNMTLFVYMTNCIISYSFNPTGHFIKVKICPNLKGYATVT